MSKILITGGSGFIGSNLVRLLLKCGADVTVFDDMSTGRERYLDGLPVDRVQGDVLDSARLSHAVPGHDAVVHLAARTGVPGSLVNPRDDCKVNVIGTLNVLEACRAVSGRRPRFVFASSNAPLGRQKPPATEDKAPLPISPYGASKLAGEGYALAYHGAWGMETVVLRFGNVYGPFSAHKDSVVARFFKDAITKHRVTVDGDGEQTRDMIFVEDLCRAVAAALNSETSGEVFQIATGRETTISSLASLIQDVVGQDLQLQHGEPRAADIRYNYSAVTKASEMLHWVPTTDLREGLERTWLWFDEHYSSFEQRGSPTSIPSN